jgi:hypothetical protein
LRLAGAVEEPGPVALGLLDQARLSEAMPSFLRKPPEVIAREGAAGEPRRLGKRGLR